MTQRAICQPSLGASVTRNGTSTIDSSKIDVDGTGYDVLPRDVQVDPVTDKPLHLDFLRVGPDSIITVHSLIRRACITHRWDTRPARRP